MKSVHEAISDYVEANNTTKDALLRELGFGRSAFFMKVRGDSEFTLSEAYRLAKTIGCTVDEFYEMTQVA